MNFAQMRGFYIEAMMLRNVDALTIDLMLRAEGLTAETASVKQCKAAVMKYQYIDPKDAWLWKTAHGKLKDKLEGRKGSRHAR